MLIRTATIDDAQWITTVHTDSWITSYDGIIHKERLVYMNTKEYRDQRLQRWKEILELWKDKIFVADIAWEVVWFASWWTAREQKVQWEWELYAIYLAENHKRKWIWWKLFDRAKESLLEDWYGSFWLRTLKDSVESNAFYQKKGWKLFWTQEYEIGGKMYILNGYIFSTSQ
jgi:GNAT superfamily N-acetyltransferase